MARWLRAEIPRRHSRVFAQARPDGSRTERAASQGGSWEAAGATQLAEGGSNTCSHGGARTRGDLDPTNLLSAARGRKAGTLVRLLTTSSLSIPDLCALDAADLAFADEEPGGQVVLGDLRPRGGTSPQTAISIAAANDLDCRAPVPQDCHLAEPVFNIPFSYGDDVAGRTTVRVRMPVSIATLLVADAGARAGIDVRPLLARGISGDEAWS